MPGLASVPVAPQPDATAVNSARPRVRVVNRSQLTWQMLDVERLIELDHPARAIWELSGRLKLNGFYAPIEDTNKSVPGQPEDKTNPANGLAPSLLV